MAAATTSIQMEPREILTIVIKITVVCDHIIFQTILVSGGLMNNVHLSSTELLLETGSAWVTARDLPSPRASLRGANIDNKILMTGGEDNFSNTLNEILEFDPLTGQWKLVDRMIQARAYQAVSVVNFESELCL